MSARAKNHQETSEHRSERENPGQRRQLPLAVVLISMLVGGLCALLALNTASAALEVRNRSLTDANTNASDTEQQLMRDLADKEAPASLQAQAASLGLVPNQNPAFLRLNADGSVSILGSPTPASAPPAPVRPTPAATPTASPRAKATPHPSASTSGRPAPAVTVTVTAAPRLTPTAHPTTTSTRPAPRPTSSPTGGH